MKNSTKVVKSTNVKFSSLDQKYKTLRDETKYEPMGMTVCHGKMYYRFRNKTNGQINHIALDRI